MSLPTEEVEPNHPEAPGREFRMGVEVEVPIKNEEVEELTGEGREGVDLTDELSIPHSAGGEVSYERIGDSSYGTEVITPRGGIYYRDLPDWYRQVYNAINQTSHEIEPVGFMGDTTAGLHLHVSPLTEEQARMLYELSQEAWMQIFCCTSLASKSSAGSDIGRYPVLRTGTGMSGYCRLDHFSTSTSPFGVNHSAVVNKHRDQGLGHWEWRLPEPMTPDHFDLIIEFVARLLIDREDAIAWARTLALEGDDRLTSIQRARAIRENSAYDFTSSIADTTEATTLLTDIIAPADEATTEEPLQAD